MDLTGRISDCRKSYREKGYEMLLIVNEEPEVKDMGEVNIKITKRTKARSLDSNAYFHVLCDKLRQKLGISMAECKNHLISSYGQILYIEEQAIIYKTNATPEYMARQEAVHAQHIKTGEDGAYWYRIYRGSHTYDSVEMARLIEGAITECKEQGIETATPEELIKMAALWERNRNGSKREE